MNNRPDSASEDQLQVDGSAAGRLGRWGSNSGASFWVVALVCLGLFLALRIATLRSAVLVADHDSMYYLRSIDTIAGHTPPELEDRGPDFLPAYPYVAGVVARLSGCSSVSAARAATLGFATIGFLATLGIARLYFTNTVVFVAGFLIATAPKLIFLDFSELTDPMYTSLVYVGLFLYMRWFGPEATLKQAIALGLLYGVGFLTRSEGIVLLPLLPVWHGYALWMSGTLKSDWLRGVGWSVCYVLAFCLVASPLVFSVSQQMGTFAVNGRQAWMVLLNAPGDSYDAKINSLTYSDAETDLLYVQAHPELMRELGRDLPKIRPHVKNTVSSLAKLFDHSIHQIPGSMNLLFAGAGLAVVLATRPFRQFALLCLLSSLLLVPAIVYCSFSVRYLLIAVPPVMICAAVGLLQLSYAAADLVAHWLPAALRHVTFAIAGLLLATAATAYPIYRQIAEAPTDHPDYSPQKMQPLLDLIAKHKAEDPAVIISRKAFLPYYAQAKQVAAPWTEYEGLVTYAALNDVEFLYIRHASDGHFPYVAQLRKDAPEFELLYEAETSHGPEMLFRFLRPDTVPFERAAE